MMPNIRLMKDSLGYYSRVHSCGKFIPQTNDESAIDDSLAADRPLPDDCDPTSWHLRSTSAC